MKKFKSYKDALEWMIDEVDDPYIDNIRSTFIDSEKGIETYKRKRDNGCCGFFDREIIIKGKRAMIGCNFGH